MGNIATIKIGKKQIDSLDSKQFDKLLRAELARDRDLHIDTLNLSFAENQETTVTFNNRQDSEQARKILDAITRTYFHLAAEASMLRSIS
ncbi:MAG: hypothetical protein QM703_13950 [Gemmatales bacterium]